MSATDDRPSGPTPRHRAPSLPDDGSLPTYADNTSTDADPSRERDTLPPMEVEPLPVSEEDLTPVEAEMFRRLGSVVHNQRRLGTWFVLYREESRTALANMRASLDRGLGDIAEGMGKLARDDSTQRSTLDTIRGLATKKNLIGTAGFALIVRLVWLLISVAERHAQ